MGDDKLRCCECSGPLGSPFFGAGDGTGQRFRCEGCQRHCERKRAERAEAEIEALKARLAEAERERDQTRTLVQEWESTAATKEVLEHFVNMERRHMRFHRVLVGVQERIADALAKDADDDSIEPLTALVKDPQPPVTDEEREYAKKLRENER